MSLSIFSLNKAFSYDSVSVRLVQYHLTQQWRVITETPKQRMKLIHSIIALIFSMVMIFNLGSSSAMENMMNQQMPANCKPMCDDEPVGNSCLGCIMVE